MRSRQAQNPWNIVIAIGVAFFILTTLLFIVWGRVNGDEGWYLYASKLVYEGQRPYRDFAFTQTPLLPYLYGLAQQLLGQSLYLGRITSAIFSTVAFILSVKISESYGGETAGGITALLGATFSYGIYFQSITKTYALTTFFFLLAFYALSANGRKDVKVILSTIFVLLATLTRLSALFFAFPFLLYAFLVSSAKIRVVLTALCVAAVSWGLYLALPNTDAAIWGLWTYHASQWGDTPVAGRIAQVLLARIPQLVSAFPAYLLLFGAALFLAGFRRIRQYAGRYSAALITLAGLILFILPNLITGGFLTEYFVPFLFVAFPVVGIVCAKIFQQRGKYSRLVVQVVLISALALGVLRGGFPFLEISRGLTPIGKIGTVAATVSENSSPGDKVFALEGVWVAVEAHRELLPNMSMAQFSFSSADTLTADRLHLLNGPTAWEYLDQSIPKIVLLTQLDWDLLRSSPLSESITEVLDRNYRRILREEHFGQHNEFIEIYIRRANP